MRVATTMTHAKTILCLFYLLVSVGYLYSELGGTDRLPIEALKGDPSGFVNGSVNVISGQYHEMETDISVAGPIPLTYERNYVSSYWGLGGLCDGWNINHFGTVFVPDAIFKESFLTLIGRGGGTSLFKGKHSKSSKIPEIHSVDTMSIQRGVTNSSGLFAGKTNIKNYRLIYLPKKDDLKCTLGDGSCIQFKRRKIYQSLVFDMTEDVLASGNRFVYEYIFPTRSEDSRVSKIKLLDKNNRLLSHLSVSYPDKGKECVRVDGSDKSHVIYSFSRYKKHSEKHGRYYLTSAVCSNGYKETYEYSQADGDIGEQLTRKNKPNGRYLINEYYPKNKNDGKNSSAGKIRLQKAPVGVDEFPIVTHRYEYQVSEKELTPYTSVWDALNHRTDYHYAIHRRLTAIHQWDQSTIYRKEKFLWGGCVTCDSTNLLTRSLLDSKDNVQICRSYTYDDNGNVIEENLYGNLSGHNSCLPLLNEDGKVIENGCESFGETFRYSDDGKNLLLEKSDAKTTTTFTYYPGTDLQKSCFIKGNDGLQIRKFYFYNDEAVISKEIVDDGLSEDSNNLSHVTTRLIKYIQSTQTAPIGLPHIVKEKYLRDGKECLLKKTINRYSIEGYLIAQEHYDSNNVYLYSLTWEYDSMGNVTKAVDALGMAHNKQYDINSNLIYEEWPILNHSKKYTYDYSNRLISVCEIHSDGVCLLELFRYDLLGNRIAKVDIYGNETQYVYDAFNRLIQTIHPKVFNEHEDAVAPSTYIKYDILDNPIESQDSEGFITKTLFTARGKPYKITYPDGTTEKWEYDLDGTLKSFTTVNGLIKRYFYDSFGRVVKEQTESSGHILHQVSKLYNAFHLVSETDAMGNVTLYEYDAAGRVRKVSSGERQTTYEYDSIGRIAKTKSQLDNQNHNTKINIYDLFNRVIEERMEDHDGNVLTKEVSEYDDLNQCVLTHSFTHSGRATVKSYRNSRGEKFLTIDPEGNEFRTISRFDYINEMSQRVPYIETTDPCGQVTVRICDAMGKVVQTIKKDPFGYTIQQQDIRYDLKGNPCKHTEHVISSNQLQKFLVNMLSYDSMNRIIMIDESVGPSLKRTSIHYNQYGQKEEITKQDGGKILHRYDDLGRLTEYFGSDGSFHYVYEYDANHHPISVTNQNDGTKTLKTYDRHGSVLSETLGNGLCVQYTYDHIGRPTKITYPDGSASSYTYSHVFLKTISRLKNSGEEVYSHHYKSYDLANHLISADMIKDTGSIDYTIDLLERKSGIATPVWSSHIQAYDKVGNILKKSTSDCVGKINSNYSYDPLYQLEKEEGDSFHEYIYDSVNNRLSKDHIQYNINDLNQITSDGVNNYVYDRNGNLIQLIDTIDDTMVEFKYDALDRLIIVTKARQQFRYSYDENNRRLSKCAFQLDDNDNWQEVQAIRYLYQGQNESGAYDADGNALELRVLGLGQGAEIGAAIAIEINKKCYAPIHDLHGNLACLLDADTGEIAESYRLDAFGIGKTYDKEGKEIASDNPWRFSCKRVDEETGFVYFGRRYYSPDLGRFVTADPLGLAAGPNLYAYVHNAPLNHIDLYGLFALPNFMEKEGEKSISSIKFADLTKRESTNLITSSRFDTNFHRNDAGERRERPSAFIKFGCSVTRSMGGIFLSCYGAFDPDDIGLKSQVYKIGTWNDPCKKIIYTNGMQNTLKDINSGGEMLSDMLDGYQIDCDSNLANIDIRFDIIRAGLSRIGRKSEATKTMRGDVINFLATAPSHALCLIVAHSEGGINTNNMLKSLCKEFQHHILVLAIAPGGFINKEYCKDVVHYTSSHDFVCHLDPVGKARNKDNFHILKKHKDASFFDHEFSSPTFKEPLTIHLNNFLNKGAL